MSTATGSQLTEGQTVRHNRLGIPVEIIGEVEWDSTSTRYTDRGRRMFAVLGPRGGVHALCVEMEEAVEVAA